MNPFLVESRYDFGSSFLAAMIFSAAVTPNEEMCD